MFKLYCRMYQSMMKVVSKLLPWKKQKLLNKVNGIQEVSEILRKEKIHHPLFITDNTMVKLKLSNKITDQLNMYAIYSDTVANPTTTNVMEAYSIYLSKQCDGIIALGGGSVMDCAKGVAAKVVRPNKSILKLKGLLTIRKKIPFLLAIPTTAGTGSEVTVAAVISDEETHEKYFIIDPSLTPDYAILDPNLTLTLPKHITAETGMDALTHAIEAYIGKGGDQETNALAKKAVKKVFSNLLTCYHHPLDIQARGEMLLASYQAGLAFTKAYVGYVHALSHAIGGHYQLAHGYVNAIVLPYVLDYCKDAMIDKLSALYDVIKPEQQLSNSEKATSFIKEIRLLNQALNIPKHIPILDDKDFDMLIYRAYKEAHPLYPVPKIVTKKEFRHLLNQIKGREYEW